MRCEPGEGCNAASAERAEFRQLAEERGQHGGANARNLGQEFRLLSQRGILPDEAGDTLIEVRDLIAEKGDHCLDRSCDLRLPGAVAAQFLGLSHLDQLPASSEEIGQAGSCRAERDGDGQVEHRSHPGQDTGIDAVRLGEHAGGAGELASLARIDARIGMAALSELADQVAIASAGCLEDDESIAFERLEESDDGRGRVGDLIDCPVWQMEQIDEGA